MKNSTLSLGCRRLKLSALVAAIFSVGASAQTVDLNKVEVTGSRLSRSDVETSLPVTVMSEKDIRATGQTTVAEVLRTLSFNTQGSSTPTNASTGQGVTDVNLRGLGNGRTLVLINGRRTPVDSAYFGFAVSTQFIPIGAVERIEILRDGASAIYGSDAIGGVVNIILKERQEGVSGSLQYSNPTGAGGDNKVYSISGGVTGDKFSGILAAEKRTIDPVRNADRTALAPDTANLGYGYINNSFPPTYNSTDFFGNGTNKTGPLTAAAGCDPSLIRTSPGITVTSGAQSVTTASQTECRNPYIGKADFAPAFDVSSLYGHGRWSITGEFSLFADALWVDQKSTGRSVSVTRTVTMTAANPNNPTKAASTTNLIAGVAQPTSISASFSFPDQYGRSLVSDASNKTVAVGGSWTPAAGELSFYLQSSEQVGTSYNNNAVAVSAFNSAVATGAVNIFDTSNPSNFGQFIRTGERDTSSKLSAANLNWSSQLPFLALPAGPIRYSLGLDWRKETLVESCDALSASSALSGSVCFARPEVSRNINAAYLEAVLPLLKNLELSYAGRHDQYSVPEAGKMTNRVALRYQPTSEVVLRGSYSEGFRTPNLYEINGATTTTTSNIVDRARCDAAGGSPANTACQPYAVNLTLKGGPALKPEESKSSALGGVWSPSKQFNASVDFYQVKVDKQILNIADQTVVNLEALGLNLAQYSVSLTRDASGKITAITAGSANVPGFETSGIDIEANGSIPLSTGKLASKFVLTHVINFKRAAAPGSTIYDSVGFVGQPQNLFNWTNAWTVGDWTTSLRFNYVGSYDARTPEQVFVSKVADQGRIAAYQTLDLNFTYVTSWKGRISVGARNITNQLPSLNRYAYTSNGFNPALSDINGRVLTVSYYQDFK